MEYYLNFDYIFIFIFISSFISAIYAVRVGEDKKRKNILREVCIEIGARLWRLNMQFIQLIHSIQYIVQLNVIRKNQKNVFQKTRIKFQFVWI